MKIGILTFHRAINYGAVLQCYALQEIIKELGHDVFVIDYRQSFIEKGYKYWHWMWFLKKIPFPRKMFLYITKTIKFRLKIIKFDRFRNEFLNIRDTCYCINDIPSNYDRYIIGSDQLFSFKITGGLDKVYSGFFDVKKNSRKIGYAISANKDSIMKISKLEWETILSNFFSFSLRENFLASIMKETTSIGVDVCLDPTLLTDPALWNSIIEKSNVMKEGVVLYEVRYLKGHENDLKRKATELASREGVPLINLSSGDYGVAEWLSIIKNAKCVITSSFHATVFALIFNRPLYAFKLNDGLDVRYESLLNSIEERNCLVPVDFDPLVIPEVNDNRFQKLSFLRQSSLEFLIKSIG